jgi:uncharacterized protein (TIGR02145 family)
LLLPFLCFSQGENNQWRFGSHAGLDFNILPPIPVSGCAMSNENSPVSISDSMGNLLFYSDGGYIWDKNNQVMPNGSGLIGSLSFGQPVYAIKCLANPDQYFVFCIPSYGYAPLFSQGLYYSLLDMQLNSGNGDVVAGMKNIPVPGGANATSWMSGTRHHNNKDAWLIVRSVNPQVYLSYRITDSGINLPPVISSSTVYPSYSPGEYGGWLKISPDGNRLIACYMRDTIAEFCNFNDQTGVVTPIFNFYPKYRNVKYIPGKECFSSDNHFLYLHAYWPYNSVSDFPFVLLYQYDATITDSLQFMMSEVIVDSTFAPTTYEDLQLGPDLKIYTPVFSKDSVGVIHNPEIYGSGCNFQKNAIGLNGNNVYYGLPQFLQKYKAYLHYLGSGCQSDSLHFSGDIWPPADTIRWNFGDPASGGSNISNLASPSHLFSSPGTYSVELYVRHNDNRTDTSWRTITIYPNPVPSLGSDRTICTGNTATFDAGFCLGCTYEWKNAGTGLIVGTNQSFTTGTAGNYCVKVINGNGCSGYDTVQLVTTSVPQVTNNQLTKSICSVESTNIALTSNVTGTMFYWAASLSSGNISGYGADSGLIINQVLTDNLPIPGIVTYSVTPKVGSCSGSAVDFIVTVNPGDSAKVSITGSGNNICSGTPVTFTAVPINPGVNPVYQWKVNGIYAGGNSPVFTYTPVNGDQVQCILTSSITVCISNNPALSNVISMVVNPLLPVSVSVSASANNVCAGTAVTFTAAAVNGGLTPVYQWKVNGSPVGTNSPVYTYTPLNNDAITCTLTSSEACLTGNPATSSPVIIAVNPLLPVSVSISASSNPFCPGLSVTFTATPGNGGANPSFQWKVNGVNAGTNSTTFTYNPLNNDSVRCVMTSTLSCISANPATSNKIILSGSLAPLLTFTPCFDTITTVNAKSIRLKGGIPFNGVYSGPGVSAGIFDPAVAGVGTKIITYTYTNVFLCSANKSKTIIVQNTAPFTCGNMLIDIRDSKTYPTVQIGTQCWMAANLNRGSQITSSQVQFDNCLDEKYCFGNDAAKCSKYGGLYQWDEMMRYDDTPAGQGLCPPGWHIPTDNDWTVLCNFYNGNGFAGKPLQDTIISGFRALTGGVFYLNSSWSFADFGVLFWTSSSWGSYKALSHGMNTINFSVSLYPSSRANAFPVRCLHD